MEAYVLSGTGDNDVKQWLKDYAGATIATALEDADLVVFTGGSDVTPSLYGEANVASQTNWLRDAAEKDLFHFLKLSRLPMFGICRGSQFLNVMMGGSLFQDVDGHCCQHNIVDVRTGIVVPDTCSTHHQMIRLGEGGELIARSEHRRSTEYVTDKGALSAPAAEALDIPEVEAYRYGNTVMGIQGHPEWGGHSFAVWGANLLNQFYEAANQ